MLVSVALYDRGMVGQGFTFALATSQTLEELIGSWVRVPFGAHEVRGLVVGVGADLPPGTAVHEVIRVEEPPFGYRPTPMHCALMLWMSSFYRAPLHRVVRLCIPEPLWMGTFQPKHLREYRAHVSLDAVPRTKKSVRRLVEWLTVQGVRPRSAVREQFSTGVLKAALDAGYILERTGGLLSPHAAPGPLEKPKTLSREQRAILDGMQHRYPETALLYGVTGAGKTEIYVHLAARLRAEGRQTVLLVPEIALTPQLLRYFSGVFGDRLAVLHSRLSLGEKCQEWLRVAAGDVDVVLGSRSALFAPFRDLGQIILDEEHEWTYKNEQNPKYVTHTVAEAMVGLSPTPLGVLFASGTPALERLARARGDVPGSAPLGLYVLDQRIYEQTFSDKKSL